MPIIEGDGVAPPPTNPVYGAPIGDEAPVSRVPTTETSSGSSGSSGGGSGTSPTTSTSSDPTGKTESGLSDFTDDEQTRFNGLPGEPQIWKDADTGVYYVVYFPESGPQPPVPLLFEIATEEELKSLFGDKKPVADKELSEEDMLKAGAVYFGEMASIDRYNAQGELIRDPWAGFTSRMERAMEQMPWLAEDPQVFAIVAGAYLEGRELEDWELEGTNYYDTHSKAERDAMRLQLSDPEGYKDRGANYVTSVYDEVSKYGIDPHDDVVAWIAEKYNSGMWTWSQAQEQIQAYAGRGGSVELDADFNAFLKEGEHEVGGATSDIGTVKDMFEEWLGPAFPPDDAAISKWASLMASNPAGGRDALTEHLRSQRLVLFPAYENENATYADISAPWKSYTANIWGVPIDEKDPVFQSIIQLNDPVEAQKQARTAGSERGYARVVKTMQSDLERSMRSGVRGAV